MWVKLFAGRLGRALTGGTLRTEGIAMLALVFLTALLQSCCGDRGAALSGPAALYPAHPEWGEYRANLNLLRSFYTPPQNSDESNYFIDMDGRQSLRNFAVSHGLTNNHALFVFMHGKAIETPLGLRYAFYTEEGKREPAGCYSIHDLARILGRAHASQIHNLVL